MAGLESGHQQAKVREDWRKETNNCHQGPVRVISWYGGIHVAVPVNLLTIVAEEFNKYLGYVRNLGFEDTPDYDYLRDLFTQALKNTGEVEDGEYDWMKLNNGKGWEAMKQHPSHHLHAANAVPNSSARALGGGPDTARGGPPTPGVTAARLNAAQPPPPSPAKVGVGKTRERLGASGAAQLKRQSGAVVGGLSDIATPTASTQAQFQSSTAHLPHRMSQINPGIISPQMTSQQQQQQITRQATAEPPPTTLRQKILKAICCGR